MQRWIVSGLVLALTQLPLNARAGECTHGDLRAMFQSIEIFYAVQTLRKLETRMVGQAYDSVGGPCQYRLWAGSPNFVDENGDRIFPPPVIQTFEEGQFFLGGSIDEWDYVQRGVPRKDAIEDILLHEEHVYLIPTDSNWNWSTADMNSETEVRLMTTKFRDVVSFANLEWFVGHVVSRQIGFIGQLPAGRYVSVFTDSYPGNPSLASRYPAAADRLQPFEDFSDVYLDIVPAAP